jgi:hypothetical protein
MRSVTALCALLLMTGASLCGAADKHSQVVHGKIMVAQSYCGICAEANTSCRLGCNGAGACIQACYDQYRDCLRQNFCRYPR